MAEAKTTVRLLEDRHVMIDGRLRGPGEEVSVSKRDGLALVGEAYAELVGREKATSKAAGARERRTEV